MYDQVLWQMRSDLLAGKNIVISLLWYVLIPVQTNKPQHIP